ncbi:MAG: glycosyltransferase [Deltaproteobacteria bacterium]|nr:glycosyltransferase [Deltaproteobacteria bacterium]MBN2673048.1 glycosyltransferase [Deltaproteobacteria bacterium]
MKYPVLERDVKLSAGRRKFFESVAYQHETPGPFKTYYNERLKKLVGFNIPKGASVLELGCGFGDLLAYLEPRRGVGVDFSAKMIAGAKERHPHLEFIYADVHELDIKEQFEYVLLSNLIGDLVDVQRVLSLLESVCTEKTRIIITDFNYLWSPLVKLAELIKIKPRQREQNWLELQDLKNLLAISNFETVKTGRDMLCPVDVPLISTLMNDFLGSLPGLSRFSVNELIVARPKKATKKKKYKVSVIVACKDEYGNIEEIFRTVPKMGAGTELIFVDGHSDDGTVEEIERCIGIVDELNPDLDSVKVMVQPGKGKGDAVRMGFDAATGDILMILDADITVRSEELPKFYNALVNGQGEFINGTRLVYPMESEAMRFLNMLGNHFFGWVFSYLLDQRLTDTLCGTKVLFKEDYEAIKRGRTFFGDFDPFGDFDLLFGAAKQNMKICEVPIRYRNREYGDIKIDRFKHGLLLLKMSALAYKRFKLYKGRSA